MDLEVSSFVTVQVQALYPDGVDSSNESTNSSSLFNNTLPHEGIVQNKETSLVVGLVPWVYTQVINHRELVVRGLIVVGTLGFLLLVFIVVQIFR